MCTGSSRSGTSSFLVIGQRVDTSILQVIASCLPSRLRMKTRNQSWTKASFMSNLILANCWMIYRIWRLRPRKENQIIRERAKRSNSLLSKKSVRDMNDDLRKSLNMVEEAEELDMDHMWVEFDLCCVATLTIRHTCILMFATSFICFVQLHTLLRLSLGIHFYRPILLHVVEASHDYSPHSSVPL